MNRPSSDERKRIKKRAKEQELENEEKRKTANQAALLNLKEIRKQYYQKMFGNHQPIIYDNILCPDLSVFVYSPEDTGKDFFTYITSGLSDYKADTLMAGRSELVFYSKDMRKEYADMLLLFSQVVIESELDISHGDVLPHGNPPTPLFKNMPWTHVLFHETGIDPESDSYSDLIVGEEPVYILNVMPISTSEYHFICENDVAVFGDLFDERYGEEGMEIFNDRRKPLV